VQVYDGRQAMRTVADALAKLGHLARDGAEIGVLTLQLPDGGAVAPLILVMAPLGGATSAVRLPAADRFAASDTYGERRQYEIAALHGAKVDDRGNVDLGDGGHVHAVELLPARMPEDFSEEEKSILICVLDLLDLKKDCVRPLDPEFAPNIMVLDYSLVAQVGATAKLPSLKAIERKLVTRMPKVTRQALADVLARAGLRLPRSGKRARGRLDASSF